MLPFLPFFPPISPGGLPLTFIIVRRLGKRSGVFWWFKTMSSLVPQLPKNATTKKHQLHLCRHKICSKYTLTAHNQQAHYPCHAPHLTGFPSVSWLPAHYDQLEAPSSLVVIRRPASVTFSLIYTIRCFKPHNPYIICVFIRKVLHFLTSRGFKDIKYNPHRPLRAWRPWWPLLAMVAPVGLEVPEATLSKHWANTDTEHTLTKNWKYMCYIVFITIPWSVPIPYKLVQLIFSYLTDLNLSCAQSSKDASFNLLLLKAAKTLVSLKSNI